MIAYAMLGSNDVPRAREFWDPVAALLGAAVAGAYTTENRVWYGVNGAPPLLVVTKPWDEKPASVSNGAMLALSVASKSAVDEVHAKALELGGADEGAPGLRGGPWYGAYFRDLDGNKAAVFTLVDA